MVLTPHHLLCISRFALAAHFLWALWGISSALSAIPFQYIEFAESRFAAYDDMKVSGRDMNVCLSGMCHGVVYVGVYMYVYVCVRVRVCNICMCVRMCFTHTSEQQPPCLPQHRIGLS